MADRKPRPSKQVPSSHTPSPGEGLDALLSPRSIAVIGASGRPDALGARVFHNLLASGFTGPVYPINPRAASVQSVRAFPDVASLPEVPDLAVIIVPRDAVRPVLEACGERGVKAAVVISAGFAETGPEGAKLEEGLVDTARMHGMRLLGPNCMGAVNTDPAVRMDATFSPVRPLEGSVALVSQSGALGVAILNLAADLSLGLSQFLSIGNRADVGVVDALAYWEKDARTRVVAMYLESFGSVGLFLETARRISRRKPLIAVKAGRSAAGARAASSHTGALATSDRLVEALLQQSGVLRAPTVQDLCHWASAFTKCPLPAGRRVAIVTNAGGPGIMAVDACSLSGLEMPALSAATQKALRGFLPPEAAVTNPVDMISSATASDYRKAVERVLADPGIDMVLVLNVTPILYRPVEVVEELARVTERAHKPCLSVFMAEDSFYAEAALVPGAPPIYRFPETAVQAMRAMVDYAEWRARPETSFTRRRVARNRVTEILDRIERPRHAVDARTPCLIPYGEASDLLEAYGVRLPKQVLAREPAGAARAAAGIGGKVALKAMVDELMHKSDVGGVALHLQGAAEVLAAAQRMQEDVAAAGGEVQEFLVQQMVGGGVELIVGARREEGFGVVLMVGLGGLFAEALRDVQLRLLPVTPTEAEEMLLSLRGYPLLAGKARGPGVHIPTLVELLGRVARMAEEVPGLVEVELNPVICSHQPGECVAVDAVLRMEGAPPEA